MTTPSITGAQMDQLAINTIRTLSMDAVQAANSGHPGTPMALAPLVYALWNRVMRFDPQDPIAQIAVSLFDEVANASAFATAGAAKS